VGTEWQFIFRIGASPWFDFSGVFPQNRSRWKVSNGIQNILFEYVFIITFQMNPAHGEGGARVFVRKGPDDGFIFTRVTSYQ
jgi:hypothetical protein